MADTPTLRFLQPRSELKPYVQTIWIVESQYGSPSAIN
jgi:hypothetical protein